MKHLRRLWFMHDYFQNFRNEIRSSIGAINGNMKVEAEKAISPKLAGIQSHVDKSILQMAETIGKLNAKISHQEVVIKDLCEYLKIEYIPSFEVKAHFEKIKK